MDSKLTIKLGPSKTGEWASSGISSIEVFKNNLFVGEGNFLAIYETEDNERAPKYCPIFPSGMQISHMLFMESEEEVAIMLTSTDSFRCVRFSKYPVDGSLNTERCLQTNVGRTVDRILNGLWLSDGDVLMAMANNSFHLYEQQDTNELSYQKCNIYSGVPCILYSAELTGKALQEVKAFVGTVFSKIQIYSLQYNDKTTMGIQIATLLFSIAGHDGVIFSLKYFEDQHILLSTSDDRKVIVWRTELGPSTTISLEEELVGHTARVFKAMLCGKDVVSVGEDSSVITWQYREGMGRALRVLPGHGGSSVRGCTYDEAGQSVYTSGDDGSISRWKLDINCTDQVEFPLVSVWNNFVKTPPSEFHIDFPRRICLVDESMVVATTNLGKVCLISDTSNVVEADSSLIKYQALAVSQLYKVCAIGSLYGIVRLISLQSYPDVKYNDANLFQIPDGRKVMSIFWTPDYLVISSQMNMYFYYIEASVLPPELPTATSRPDYLPLSIDDRAGPERSQVSAVHGFDYYIIVGFNTGDIEIIDMISMERAIFSARHTTYGVGGITIFNNLIVTGGHDGKLRYFDPTPLLLKKNTEVEVVYSPMAEYGEAETVICEIKSVDLPFQWVTGIFQYRDTMLVLGFESTDCIIYCVERDQIIVRISCGGSHRSWDFHCSESGRFGFVYLKNQKAFKVLIELDSFLGRCVKPGIHKNQINCVTAINSYGCGGDIPCFFASGSEDCTVEIFGLSLNQLASEDEQEQDSFLFSDTIVHTKMETLRIHTSGVRAIGSVWLTQGDGQLVTGGGRSELFFVPFTLTETGSKLRSCGIPRRVRFETYMDFRVLAITPIAIGVPWENPPPFHRRSTEVGSVLFAFVACSDGIVRFVREDGLHRSLSYRNYPRWKTHSIQVLNLAFREGEKKNHCLVYGGTSNGIIVGWTVNLGEHEFLLSEEQRKTAIQTTFTINTEHASISSMLVIPNWPNEVKLLVGFDSGCLAMCSELKEYTFRLRNNSKDDLLTVLTSCTGSVSGFPFDMYEDDDSEALTVYSASNHKLQRVLMDKKMENKIGIIDEVSTGISDCQGIVRVRFGNEPLRCGETLYYFLFYGNGIRVVSM